MQPISSYFDHALQCMVNVYPSQDAPRRKSRNYTPIKERDEQRRERSARQTRHMNAYDAAVCYGVTQDEAESVPSVMTEFEATLRQERARYNRRKAK
ncbi:hypothetical protein JCM19235_1292 [Vibrio maritimus]|uniref:Uncharacterized protein n=1 Tax=Vibrio maritimus TaxID=990268 RepID=A0A090S646_9VIBR|nr:hypothetical protein JCM19235_1292 [Vibrio maritimus]